MILVNGSQSSPNKCDNIILETFKMVCDARQKCWLAFNAMRSEF